MPFFTEKRKETHTEPEQLYVQNTLHWKNPEKYQFPIEWYADKEKYHESQYPIDLQSCYDAGTRFAHRLKKISM